MPGPWLPRNNSVPVHTAAPLSKLGVRWQWAAMLLRSCCCGMPVLLLWHAEPASTRPVGHWLNTILNTDTSHYPKPK